MKPVVFFTVCSDYYKHLLPFVTKSLKHFHPDIPHVIFGQEEINKVMAGNTGITYGWLCPYFGRQLSEEYELVVNIDTDSIVLDYLTEVLVDDYNIGAPLNNNPHEPFGAWLPEIKPELDPKIYVNIGLAAIRGKQLWDEWINRNLVAKEDPRYHWQEQDTFNELFYSLQKIEFAKSRVFDGSRSDYGTPERYYGLAARLQWHLFRVENEKILLNDRPVKVFHQSGGTRDDKLKINELFSSEVCGRINQILYE